MSAPAPGRARRVSPALRWNLLGVGVVVLLVVALWPRGSGTPATSPSGAAGDRSVAAQPAAAPGDLTAERAAAGLAACPTPAQAPAVSPSGPLAGVRLPCLADGSGVDLGTALAGRPTLLNVWAWWCGPCAAELPALAEFAGRAGDRVTVLTVHADPQLGGALSRLADYGVTLPGVQDADGRVAALVGAPQVLPTTILLRPDGSVAEVLARPFTTADEIADAVDEGLGVRA